MTLRGRMTSAVMALTVLTLGGAFFAVSLTVNRSQERQLDEALTREALEEAREIAALGGERLAISDRPGPAANDVGPLTKYGVIYAPGGSIRAATPTWLIAPPARRSLPTGVGQPFDLRVGGEHLRGVLVGVPGRPGTVLLLGAPRTDLDGDAVFLRRAMTMVLLVACAWTFAVASWFVRRLTRDHRRIMDVARRAAGGDLSARVAPVSADADFSQLGRDLDETIERLATVVDAQRRFIAHASHELRSPLTALLGEITFTLRRERDAAEYRRALQEAQVAAERLKALTDDLLALARLGSTSAAESGEVLLGAAVADAVEDVSAVAQERGVAIARSGLDVLVYGHANDLRRLLRNLLENAVRHSPRGGEVRVEGRDDGEAVLLLIEDDGEGVPAEERERIFDPFFRGARARASEDGGAGLGLAIAWEIARRHRGGIACEPGTRGRGARFVVRLRTAPPAMRR